MNIHKIKDIIINNLKYETQRVSISNGMSKKPQKIQIVLPAISVKNVSKTFIVPHEKISTLRGAFTSIFKKKGYDVLHALKDVSFEVKKGEFFGIIGRNGSGKSTLLKILAGVYTTNMGSIEINGAISPFLELGIGFNPELSGRDNIYLNATVLGMSEKEIDKKFNSIVAFSELERFIDQKLKNYSSGMQVRLAFSVSIHANRDILLMDEVLAVGDSNFQSKCLDEFNRYKEMGKTVILVSHDVGTIQRYCDRAMLLRNGEIVKIGNAEDVGNEYIYQNMVDEEERILREKNNAVINTEHQNEESGKMAKITRVEFLDKNGKIKNVFQTGDDIVVRIYYSTKHKIEKPVFGVAIHTQQDIHISGPNTKTSKFSIDSINGKGYIHFTILKNTLFSGTYKFTTALYNWDCITPFDYQDRTHSFKIFCKDENQYGVCKMEHIWEK